MQRLAPKTTTAILAFLALSAGAHYAPSLFRTTPEPPVIEKKKRPEEAPKAKGKKKSGIPLGNLPLLADPSEDLVHFYEALEKAEAREPGAVARIVHYGDSPTTADLITADLRDLLQKQFGDAGHGFVLIAKPWAWYGHRGVGIKASGWKIEAASQSRAKDKLHGAGGVNFIGAPGATTTLTLPDALHTHLEVFYLKQPQGGTLQIETGGQTLSEIDTASETKESGFTGVDLPAGTAKVKLSVARNSVRVFGISFEKKEPGVIYHSLGLNGASVQMLLMHFDAAHWGGQLRHLKPDLVVLNYGSNESFFGGYLDTQYPRDVRQMLQRTREAAPEASILVMSPMDRGDRNAAGEIVTPPALPHVIEIQRKVAIEEGCAFFNTFEAMGGAGTMARWYNGKPRLVSADFLHPLPAGAAKVGGLVDKALVDGYRKWKAGRR